MIDPYSLTSVRKYLQARTAARLVPGPLSIWFLAAAARISLASSSGVLLACVVPTAGAGTVIRTGMSWVCGRLSGILRVGECARLGMVYSPLHRHTEPFQ